MGRQYNSCIMSSFPNHRPRALLVCVHRISNVPPLYNVARVLGAAGFETFVVGYQAEDRRKVERVGRNARIIRLNLKSRMLSFSPLRKAAARGIGLDARQLFQVEAQVIADSRRWGIEPVHQNRRRLHVF